MAAFLYLTGCRLQEVLPYTGRAPWPNKEAVKKNQLEVNPADPSRVKVINVRCLKRKLQKMRRQELVGDPGGRHYTLVPRDGSPVKPQYRQVPIRIDTDTQPFWDIFMAHADQVGSDQPLFTSSTGKPLSSTRAYQILAQEVVTNKMGGKKYRKGAGINPHAFRHQRYTRLVNVYRLSSQQLRRHAGWSSSITADQYVDSNADDILDSMENK